MPAAQSGAMSDHLVRVGHLKQLQKANGWDDSELGRRCGRRPQQVHAWFSGARPIGEKLARSLEEQLGLSRYALDDRAPSSPVERTTHQTGDRNDPYRVQQSLPVVTWADLATTMNADNTTLKQKAVHLETYAPSSGQAKFLQVPDDSMEPELSRGDHVLMDPAEAPHAGDIVLVRLPNNEHFLRYFRPRTAYVFEAVPGNANYLPLHSKDDQAVVVAVMVEHRRYRRAR